MNAQEAVNEDRMLTVKETAAFLRIGPQAVYRMAQRGDLPGTRVGRAWRFSLRRLEEFVAAGGTKREG